MLSLMSYQTFKSIRNYEGIKYPVSEKDYSKIEQKNKIFINVFCYENDLTYPVYVSK